MLHSIQKTALLLLLIIVITQVNAQEIQREYYGNGGNAVHSSEITLSQTFGEPLSSVFTKYDSVLMKYIFLQQGFEQNKADTTVFTYTIDNLQFYVELYPNPTNSYINIHFNTSIKDGLTINIFNDLGQSIKTNLAVQETTTIDVSTLAQGIYFLHLVDFQSQSLAIFPFIKI